MALTMFPGEKKLVENIFTADVKKAIRDCEVGMGEVNNFIDQLIHNLREQRKELTAWKTKSPDLATEAGKKADL